MNNFKILTEKFPGKFKDIENNIEEIEALKFCKKWIVERKWLKINHVDFADFADEI